MNVVKKRGMSTKTMVLGAILTAMVIVLQLLGSFTTFFGPFSAAVALVPIIIGAALCGVAIGGWLGLAFGATVLISGGANLLFMFNPWGTIITVLCKGIACGVVAGLAYKFLSKVNHYLAVFVAAFLCPVTNTAVFLLGGRLFFLEYAMDIARIVNDAAGQVVIDSSGMGVFWALAMGNFIFEVLMCVVLVPLIVKIIDMRKGK